MLTAVVCANSCPLQSLRLLKFSVTEIPQVCAGLAELKDSQLWSFSASQAVPQVTDTWRRSPSPASHLHVGFWLWYEVSHGSVQDLQVGQLDVIRVSHRGSTGEKLAPPGVRLLNGSSDAQVFSGMRFFGVVITPCNCRSSMTWLETLQDMRSSTCRRVLGMSWRRKQKRKLRWEYGAVSRHCCRNAGNQCKKSRRHQTRLAYCFHSHGEHVAQHLGIACFILRCS